MNHRASGHKIVMNGHLYKDDMIGYSGFGPKPNVDICIIHTIIDKHINCQCGTMSCRDKEL